MSLKLTEEEVYQAFYETHGDTYNYSKFEYVSGDVKSTIICPIHGEFEKTPYQHKTGSGCKHCANKIKRETFRYTEEEILEAFYETHGDRYEYPRFEYKGSEVQSIITCKIHGDFKQTPYLHKTGNGCTKCPRACNKSKCEKAKNEFDSKANIVHDNFYNYDKFIYVKNSVKGIINCPVHGDFEQTPNVHLEGSGCQKCGKAKVGYSRSTFIANAKNNESTLYIIEGIGEGERFYKVGITNTSTKRRFAGSKIPYPHRILYKIVTNPEKVFDVEKLILREFHNYKYEPKIFFEGRTECFTTELPIMDILEIINN